jgi:PKD repeat protein
LKNFKIKTNLNCLTLMTLLISCIHGFEITAQGPLPFDPRDCGLNCTANDVNITGAQLYTDLAGTTPLTGTCNIGSNVNAYIGITFVNNSNSDRGVIALAADVFYNGTFAFELKYCPSLILSGNQTKVFIIPIAISWVCGQSIELRDILGGWATGGALTTCPTICSGINSSKCSDTIPNITVLTPPTALFTFTCAPAPSIRTVVFTNNSTGGSTTALTYVWNFGDGSPTVTTASPTHTYTSNGPFNVTLTTTNSVGSDTEILATTPGNCQVQPITLASFEAFNLKNNNELKWKTSNEVQFSHFEVEKSTNAQSFKLIGKVNGIGNSKEERSYSFLDNNVFGLNYYRLKIVDLDGESDFSKVIAIQNAEKVNTIGQLYPNPSINDAKINLNAKESGSWTVKTFDSQGKLLGIQTQYLQKGINLIEVKQLIHGMNYIQFSDGIITEIRKIIKQ